MLFFSLVTFITTLQCNIYHLWGIESVNHLLDLKWQSLLNSSIVCQILTDRQEEGYQRTNITLIIPRPVDLFLLPYY